LYGLNFFYYKYINRLASNLSILQGRKVIACPPAVADPGFAKVGGGSNLGERTEREPKRGSGGGAPAGSRGTAPGEAESFLSIFMQKNGQNLSLGLYALPEENPAFFEFRKIWLPFCEIHEIYISRNIFIDAILLHKVLHSGELPSALPLLCTAVDQIPFIALQSLINDRIKWRDCSHLLNCCLYFGKR